MQEPRQRFRKQRGNTQPGDQEKHHGVQAACSLDMEEWGEFLKVEIEDFLERDNSVCKGFK